MKTNLKNMSSESRPRVSMIIVNTNELHHLKKCLPTIYKQNLSNVELLVIDNYSDDGSVEFVQQEFPQTKVIRNSTNLGYTGANNVGFKHASGEYIAVLNPDTMVHPDWLSELVKALDNHPEAGLATPKILLMDQPNLINACGNDITFTGLTFCRGLGKPAQEYSTPDIVSAVSGAAFVIRRKVLDEIGGFDESFFIYFEETDLSLRAMLAGYQCLFVPSSIVFHKYVFRFSAKKCFFQERNRYYSLLKALDWRTFLILMPALIISEILAWGYAILNGPEHIKSKLKAYIWVITNGKAILDARKKTQTLRRVRDKEILSRFSHQLTFAQTTMPNIARALERLVNPLVYILGNISRSLIFW